VYFFVFCGNFLELDAEMISAPGQLDSCRAMILPGAGAFGDCMTHLARHNFVDAIRNWIDSGKPFLAIFTPKRARPPAC
jgi:glutamine amidotransferase